MKNPIESAVVVLILFSTLSGLLVSRKRANWMFFKRWKFFFSLCFDVVGKWKSAKVKHEKKTFDSNFFRVVDFFFQRQPSSNIAWASFFPSTQFSLLCLMWINNMLKVAKYNFCKISSTNEAKEREVNENFPHFPWSMKFRSDLNSFRKVFAFAKLKSHQIVFNSQYRISSKQTNKQNCNLSLISSFRASKLTREAWKFVNKLDSFLVYMVMPQHIQLMFGAPANWKTQSNFHYIKSQLIFVLLSTYIKGKISFFLGSQLTLLSNKQRNWILLAPARRTKTKSLARNKNTESREREKKKCALGELRSSKEYREGFTLNRFTLLLKRDVTVQLTQNVILPILVFFFSVIVWESLSSLLCVSDTIVKPLFHTMLHIFISSSTIYSAMLTSATFYSCELHAKANGDEDDSASEWMECSSCKSIKMGDKNASRAGKTRKIF